MNVKPQNLRFAGNDLPEGWVLAELREVLEVHYGKGLTKSARNETGTVPVYGSNGKVGYHDVALVTGPCIIIGRKGAAGAVHFSAENCWPIDTTYYTRPPDELSVKYMFYLLGSLNLEELDRSTAIPGLNRDDLYAQQVPIPPLPEQHRIVAEIETQFSRLDAGVAALKRVQAALRRYKASVLKAACEGRLVPTEAALARTDVGAGLPRAGGPRPYEPASALLARILAGRRAQEERANPGKRYVEPKGTDAEGLAELPEGWVWASLEELSTHIVDCLHSTPKFVEQGLLCVDTNCIEPGRIVFERARYVDEDTFRDRIRRLAPEAGDVLFSREGTIGTALVVPENLDLCLGQRMMMFRPSACVSSDYFMCAMSSQSFEEQWKPKVVGTTAPHVNIGDLRIMGLPVPPLAEQHRIVAEVERRLSVAQEVEGAVAAGLRRVERLRQSILKQAFAGRLVM